LGDHEDPVAAIAFFEKLRTTLRELLSVVDVTREWARAKLAEAAGYPPDDQGFADFRAAAPSLRARLDDPKARDLCVRLDTPDPNAAEVGALSLVAMRPVESWTDADRDQFAAKAMAITRELRAEAIRGGNLSSRETDQMVQAVADDLYRNLSTLHEPLMLLAALKRLVRKMEEEVAR
jgi:hypothetical protein